MRCLALIAVVIAVTTARPEVYKEKEDFQYSRSSSDEGTKSGYYGAQRGNMGGNYERAHNMDSTAQNQMSGLIHQVDGELGQEAANTKTGSVFTASNSRGLFGSGHYDTSNLEGRNFQEGASGGNLHSQSALSNSAYRDHASGSNAYSNSNSYSHSSSRQRNSERSDYEQRSGIQSSNLRSGDNIYQQEYGAYDGSSSLSHSSSPYQNRLVSTRPMRILVRPGTRVAAPIATQTYDAEHSASSYDASVYNQNAAKGDAEVIINNDHESNNRPIPENKHYESSYSYRKEWEKHHSSPGTVPLSIDTAKSIPKTSELYDDSQQSQAYNSRNQQYTSNAADSHSRHSSNAYGYNTKNNFASSNQQQSEYDIQREKLSSDLNAITNNAHQSNFDATDYTNQLGTTNSKPKSYQSSYSYHKSWERQGDPYVIVPVPNDQNGQESQRLSTASDSHSGYSSHQYASNRKQSHQSYSNSNGLMDCDCDDEGHVRVPRSYNPDQEVQQQQNGWDDAGQQSQNLWDGQQTQNQWDKLEDLGQQTQNSWNKLDNLGQQAEHKWDKIEDLGQQSQQKWDKIEDLGQQTQNSWNKLDDLTQQSAHKWDRNVDLGQEQQNHWDKIQDLGQQTQNQWDKTEDLGQHSQTQWGHSQDLEQQSQSQWDRIEDLGQHTQDHFGKHDQFEQSQSNVDQEQAIWHKLEKSHEQSNTNNFESQGTSDTVFEENYNHFSTQNTFGDIYPSLPHSNNGNALSYINNLQNHQHFYDSQDKQTEQKNEYSHLYTPDNTMTDSKPEHTNSIVNLWDKLDRLDRESTFNNYNTDQYTPLDKEYQSSLSDEKSTTTEKSKVTDKTVIHPKDIGRGDIGSEDAEFETSSDTTENANLNTDSNLNEVDKNTYKTAQIEAFSLSDHNDATNTTTFILESNQQQNNNFSNKNIEVSSERQQDSKININQHSINYDFGQHEQQNEDKDLQFMNHQDKSNSYGISEKADQENIQQYSEHSRRHQSSVTIDQQNMEQDLENVDKADVSFDQQNYNQDLTEFNKFADENLNQQSMSHSFETLSQPIEYQDQQNMQQNLQSFDKLNENIEQESQNLMDFSKLNENIDQQRQQSMSHYSENSRRHQSSENIDQQNKKQDLENVGKGVENFDQQNYNQDLTEFNKADENLNQQSMSHNFETLNQPIEYQDQQHMQQNMQGFDKLNENIEQENQDLIDFSKLNENFEQQSMHHYSENSRHNQSSENIDQQNEKQDLENVGKADESFDQQNYNQDLTEFNQADENLNQQSMSHNFETLNQPIEYQDLLNMQQNMQGFDKLNENFEQQNQNPMDFSKLKENIDQQSLHHYSENTKHHQFSENKDQQDLENVGNADKSFQQQNLNQNFINIDKVNENINKHDVGDKDLDLGQELESGSLRENFDKQNVNMKMESTVFYRDNSYQRNIAQSNSEVTDSPQENTFIYTPPSEHDQQDIVSQTTVPPEPENTGFWSSIGKKFSNAKVKVTSWFQKKSE